MRTSFANRQSSEASVVREGSDGTWSCRAASRASRAVGICVNELSSPVYVQATFGGLKSRHQRIEQSELMNSEGSSRGCGTLLTVGWLIYSAPGRQGSSPRSLRYWLRVTSGKWLRLPEPPFLHLYNENLSQKIIMRSQWDIHVKARGTAADILSMLTNVSCHSYGRICDIVRSIYLVSALSSRHRAPECLGTSWVIETSFVLWGDSGWHPGDP